tara:strand:+ start:849 stop:1646 length:798 start_codon:yes stop_codon:yes gene_type:complete
MLEITINNEKKVFQFTTILQNLKNISSELTLDCNKNGIYAQGMDSGHVCLFELQIGSQWFDSYTCTTKCSMGINCEMLFKIISCLKEGQYIDMKHDPDSSKLTIDLLGNSYDKSFEMSLIDMENEFVELPEKEYTADIRFVSKDYAELINQLSIFGNKLTISCGDDIILNSENEFGKVDITVKEKDIIEYMMEEDSQIESYYGIRYVNMITKFSNVNKEIGIHISNNFPIKFVYNLEDWKDSNDEDDAALSHYIAFYLAPLEEDD